MPDVKTPQEMNIMLKKKLKFHDAFKNCSAWNDLCFEIISLLWSVVGR